MESPSAKTLYAMDQDGDMVPLNFTEISAKLMDAVVHISSFKQLESGRGIPATSRSLQGFFR
jgi:hypothetical protein